MLVVVEQLDLTLIKAILAAPRISPLVHVETACSGSGEQCGQLARLSAVGPRGNNLRERCLDIWILCITLILSENQVLDMGVK